VPEVHLSTVSPGDLEALVAIRIAAMQESLQRIGRFDPQRARERFTSSFQPQNTWHIECAGQRVGFVITKRVGESLHLEHLYVLPEWQGRGIGAAVLEHVFAEANASNLPVHVGALRESASNRFYMRHGFRLVEQAEFDNFYVRPTASAA
jgi:GNAT superfamily N-acetyltransferase